MMVIRLVAFVAFMLLLGSTSSAREDVHILLTQAKEAYSEGDFQTAVRKYEECIERGIHDARVYYNLGNAHFKQGQLGESILYFERAKLIAPYDEAIQHNLNVANARIRDRVEPIPLLFVVQWWNELKEAHSVAGLFTGSVFLYWIFALMVFVFFGFRNVIVRRFALAIGLLVGGLSVASTVLVIDKQEDIQAHRYGIILPVEVSVSSAPDKSGVDAFLIHEGLKVEVLAIDSEVLHIRLPDGKEGWVPKDAVQRI